MFLDIFNLIEKVVKLIVRELQDERGLLKNPIRIEGMRKTHVLLVGIRELELEESGRLEDFVHVVVAEP